MKLRKAHLVLATLCLLACSASVPAQAGLIGFGGLNLPTGSFNDDGKTGWGLGAGYDFPLVPLTAIGVAGAYNTFGLEHADGNFNAFQLMATGRLTIPGGIFGQLGLGFASWKLSIEGLDSSRSTDFTWQIGGGWKIALIELMLMYNQISTDDSSSNWFMLGAGVHF